MEEGEDVVLPHRHNEEIRKVHHNNEALNRAISVDRFRITLCVSKVLFRQDLEVRARIHGVVDVGPEVFV